MLERAVLAQVTPSWMATGSLNIPRSDHTATLLPDNRVLVAGGFWVSYGFHETAELYDPVTGTWNFTGSLNAYRSQHTATLLPNGKVLVAGGAAVFDLPVKSAELYDPATEQWKDTASLLAARYGHTATLLPNGTVLVAGGTNDPELFHFLASAELYDPATGKWDETADLGRERYQHTATLLPDGRVLVAGGYSWSFLSLNEAELYNSTTGNWSGAGSLNTERAGHTATLLPNGMILVAGGYNFEGNRLNTLDSAELFDPATGTWSVTGHLNTARTQHTATLLPNGKVLVAGGYVYGSVPPISITSAELYDPATGNWSATANLATPRWAHTATLLPNGKVLVAGGDNRGALQSAELYDAPSTLIAAVLPGSRSVQIGTPATAFATIINTGQTTATGCAISRITSIPATFTYQTTSLATNQVIGSPNTPVDITSGAAQSFVIALTPNTPIAPIDIQLSFDCANTDPAPIISGLNTLLFSASATPTPDIMALVATPSNDGIVNILGTNGMGVFTVATVNLGAGDNLTVSADTGGAPLPVNTSICQTDPQVGVCLSPPASSVTTTILSHQTPTFGVFLSASGDVPFAPATNRIFVRFKDSGNVTRGSTSVAVRTQ